MRRWTTAAATIAVAVITGCSSTSSPTNNATSRIASAPTTSASAGTTPVPRGTSPDPAGDSTVTTSNKPDGAESVGTALGGKIAFYAVAKAAGMNDSAKMDALAEGICTRIKSGNPATVGPWMKDTFELQGDVAAKVAIAAITAECPKYKSLVGS